MSTKTKIIVVVGPTASGKTKLAVELAKRFQGEVVSADSMQIYQGMSIATAKPTQEEMEGIPHHLMDFLPMDQPFNVSDYVTLANEEIQKIVSKGHLPFVAGGTGLYVNSLIDGISFSPVESDEELRKQLYEQAKEDEGQSLYQYLCEIDPDSAAEIHPNNLVRVIRAVEIYRLTGITMTEHKKKSRECPSQYEVCMIGLNYHDRQKLYDRINLRVDQMMEQGLLDEAKQVLSHGSLKTAMNAIGYKELIPYFQGEDTLDHCIDKIKQESRRYAKRQLTWFRRDTRINWIFVDEFSSFREIMEKSEKCIESFLDL